MLCIVSLGRFVMYTVDVVNQNQTPTSPSPVMETLYRSARNTNANMMQIYLVKAEITQKSVTRPP